MTKRLTPETRDDPAREKVGGRLELISRSSVPSNAGIMKQRHAGRASQMAFLKRTTSSVRRAAGFNRVDDPEKFLL